MTKTLEDLTVEATLRAIHLSLSDRIAGAQLSPADVEMVQQALYRSVQVEKPAAFDGHVVGDLHFDSLEDRWYVHDSSSFGSGKLNCGTGKLLQYLAHHPDIKVPVEVAREQSGLGNPVAAINNFKFHFNKDSRYWEIQTHQGQDPYIRLKSLPRFSQDDVDRIVSIETQLFAGSPVAISATRQAYLREVLSHHQVGKSFKLLTHQEVDAEYLTQRFGGKAARVNNLLTLSGDERLYQKVKQGLTTYSNHQLANDMQAVAALYQQTRDENSIPKGAGEATLAKAELYLFEKGVIERPRFLEREKEIGTLHFGILYRLAQFPTSL